MILSSESLVSLLVGRHPQGNKGYSFPCYHSQAGGTLGNRRRHRGGDQNSRVTSRGVADGEPQASLRSYVPYPRSQRVGVGKGGLWVKQANWIAETISITFEHPFSYSVEKGVNSGFACLSVHHSGWAGNRRTHNILDYRRLRPWVETNGPPS